MVESQSDDVDFAGRIAALINNTVEAESIPHTTLKLVVRCTGLCANSNIGILDRLCIRSDSRAVVVGLQLPLVGVAEIRISQVASSWSILRIQPNVERSGCIVTYLNVFIEVNLHYLSLGVESEVFKTGQYVIKAELRIPATAVAAAVSGGCSDCYRTDSTCRSVRDEVDYNRELGSRNSKLR